MNWFLSRRTSHSSLVHRFVLATCVCALIFTLGSELRADAAPLSEQLNLDSAGDQSSVSLPAEIPPLPGPHDTPSRFIVNDKNVALFHDLLLGPIAAWLKQGKIVIKVVKNLDFLWQLDAGWRDGTTRSAGRFSLDAKWNLKLNGEVPEQGFPFGNYGVLDEEKDPVKKAYEILWNLQYISGSIEDLLYDTELAWLGSRNLQRTASGAFYRRFFAQPHAEPTTSLAADDAASADKPPLPAPTPTFGGADDIFYQEVLRLLAPPVVFGFGELSWRYRGPNEDLLWLHSPVIGRTREIFGSNRADPLLGGILSFDDLQVWSGKVQSVKARVVDEKVMLLPLPSLVTYRLETEQIADTTYSPDGNLSGQIPQLHTPEPEEDVLTIRGNFKRTDGSTATVLWNYETGEFPRSDLWFPTTVAFVPRRVWVIEASPTDPFVAGGRRVLIVDKESMLPFYKLVYAQGGDLEKLVIGGWALASSSDNAQRFPFLGFVLAVDAAGEHAMAVTNHSIKVFTTTTSKALANIRKLLDISTYRKEDKPTGKQSTKSAASDDEADDESNDSEKQTTAPPAAPPSDAGGF